MFLYGIGFSVGLFIFLCKSVNTFYVTFPSDSLYFYSVSLDITDILILFYIYLNASYIFDFPCYCTNEGLFLTKARYTVNKLVLG